MTTLSTLRRQWAAEFEVYCDEVDAIVTRRLGRSAFSLGDYDLSAMWLDDRESPATAARRLVRAAREAGAL